jgi:hypothetical protein
MTDIGRRDVKHCPGCGRTMFLMQVMATFGPLPETRRYRCSECPCVVDEEIETGWAAAIRNKMRRIG